MSVRPSLVRMFSPLLRVGLGAAALTAVLGLTACGGDDGAATVTTVNIRPSSYEVRPPATPAPTVPAIPVADAEGRSAAEQSYTVHEDEYPSEIAQLFDVSLDELRNFNGWDDDYANYPAAGGTVRIPPGAKFIDPAATTTTVAGDDDETETSDSTDDGDDDGTEEAGGDRCNPTYTIEAGDAPFVVVAKFDITIEQLNAANVSTPDWPNFYTGRDIKLPPPSDCAGGAAAATTTTTTTG